MVELGLEVRSVWLQSCTFSTELYKPLVTQPAEDPGVESTQRRQLREGKVTTECLAQHQHSAKGVLRLAVVVAVEQGPLFPVLCLWLKCHLKMNLPL